MLSFDIFGIVHVTIRGVTSPYLLSLFIMYIAAYISPFLAMGWLLYSDYKTSKNLSKQTKKQHGDQEWNPLTEWPDSSWESYLSRLPSHPAFGPPSKSLTNTPKQSKRLLFQQRVLQKLDLRPLKQNIIFWLKNVQKEKKTL